MEVIGNLRENIYDQEETEMQITLIEREKGKIVIVYNIYFYPFLNSYFKKYKPIGIETMWEKAGKP